MEPNTIKLKHHSHFPLSIKPTHFTNTSHNLRPLIFESQMGNVVELKVDLDCDGCIKKTLKAIKKIEDIETYDIDIQLNKVTVTGNVTSEEVIRVLNKIGKQACNWGENRVLISQH